MIGSFAVKGGEVVYFADAADPNNPTASESQVVSNYLAAADAKSAAVEAIYAPVEVDGKLYPADGASLFKYEAAKQSKGRGKLAKAIAIAVDGTPLKLSTAQAIDDFHAAIEAVITARIEAVHDAL